jgi:Ca-activated chloride channel homolog
MQSPGNIVRLFFFLPLAGIAQEDAKLIYEGNEEYHSGKMPQASASYARAAELNPANRKANFNLGNALYKNGMLLKEGKLSVPPGNAQMTPDSLAGLMFDNAAQNFAVVANSVSDRDTLHRAWHNIGNCYLQKKDYREAVTAYKKALRLDPKDEESRYNLAYALKHLPKEDRKGGGGSSDKQQEKQQDQKKQQKQQQPQMSKEQAEQLLRALMDEERKLQEKRRQKQQDASNTTVDKDW